MSTEKTAKISKVLDFFRSQKEARLEREIKLNIQEIIGFLQNGIISESEAEYSVRISRTSLVLVRKVEERVAEGKQMVQETGEIFAEIKQANEETAVQVEQTTNSTQDLAQSSDEVNKAASEIEGMSDEITKFAQELSELAQNLQGLVEDFEV